MLDLLSSMGFHRLTPAMKLPGINGAYLFDPREIEQLASKKGPAK